MLDLATVHMSPGSDGPGPVVMFHHWAAAQPHRRFLSEAGFFWTGEVWAGSLEAVGRLIVAEHGYHRFEDRLVELSFETKAAMSAAWQTLPVDLRTQLMAPGRNVVVERSDEQVLAARDAYRQSCIDHEEQEALRKQRAKEVVAYMKTRKVEALSAYQRYGDADCRAVLAVTHIVDADTSVFQDEMELRTAMRLAAKGSRETTMIESGLAWIFALRHLDLVPRDGKKLSSFWWKIDNLAQENA